MLSRVLVLIGVGIWCILVLPGTLQVADSVGDWLVALGLGVVAPVLLIWQVNRVISHYEQVRRAQADARAADSGSQERELLRALAEYGALTPTAAALQTSLTIDEATTLLRRLAQQGHLQTVERVGGPAYALVDHERLAVALPAVKRSLPPGETHTSPGPVAGPPGPPSEAVAGPPGPPPRLLAEAVADPPGPPPEPLVEPLSERELEVLALLATGRSNQEIASTLVLSVGTVKSHTNSIYRKLAVRNRTEAVARARALALI